MKTGDKISRYRIVGPLGKGGMGVVYEAEDLRLGRKVALKFLPDECLGEIERKRFLNEARAAAKVRHPNICPMYDVEEVDGQVFLAMAYIAGETLSRRIRKGIMPLGDVLRCGRDLASGLEAAHAAGIVHRDIKSNNVMIDEAGRVMILDFGLALLGGEERLTIGPNAVGTPAYMSPEQARGGKVDVRTDLWALGVVLYEMTTGKLPGLDPVPLRDLRPDASVELEQLVTKAMAEKVANRWQSAQEMGAALERISNVTISSMTQTLVLDVQPARRPSIIVGLVAAALLAVAGWGVYRSTAKPQIAPAAPARSAAVRRVAILPLSAKGDQAQIVSDGLLEVWAATIGEAEREGQNIWAVPISEVLSRKLGSAEEARKVYGVDLAIRGTAEMAGTEVKLVLQLIDTATLKQVGEQKLTYDAARVLPSRDLAVGALKKLLAVEIRPESGPLKTAEQSSGVGYGAYLEGRGLMARREKSGNVDRAIQRFELAIVQDGKFALAYASLGEAHWTKAVSSNGSSDSAEKAIRYAKRAVELDETLAPAHAKLGKILAASGKQAEGILELERALQLSPGNAEALRELAEVYTQQGKFGEAEKLFKEAIAARPTNWLGHTALAYFYENRGKLNESEQHLRLAGKYAPENSSVVRNLGRLFRMRGKYAEAVEQLQRSIQLHPNANAYNSLGLTYYYMHQYRASVVALEAAIDLEGRIHQYWGNLGASCAMSPEDRGKAVPALRKAVELAENVLRLTPADYSVMSSLAEYRARLGDAKGAMAEVKKIPESAKGPLASRLVLAYELSGARREAIQTVRMHFTSGQRLREILDEPVLERLQADGEFKKFIAGLQAQD